MDRGIGSGASVASREPQITQMAVRQAQVTKTLHDLLDKLESRLSPALRSAPPHDGIKSTEKRNGELVQHAAHLADVADLIEAANSRIDDIMTRLEL